MHGRQSCLWRFDSADAASTTGLRGRLKFPANDGDEPCFRNAASAFHRYLGSRFPWSSSGLQQEPRDWHERPRDVRPQQRILGLTWTLDEGCAQAHCPGP